MTTPAMTITQIIARTGAQATYHAGQLTRLDHCGQPMRTAGEQRYDCAICGIQIEAANTRARMTDRADGLYTISQAGQGHSIA